MKLNCEVTKVSNSGETLKIVLSGRQRQDAEWRYDRPQEIEVTCTDKLKRAFYLGRRVTLTIDPR